MRSVLLVLALAAAVPSQAASIRRSANRADGAPTFDIADDNGKRVGRIECLWNGFYDADAMAARVLSSRELMAAILAKGADLSIEDLGPAIFNCVFVKEAWR